MIVGIENSIVTIIFDWAENIEDVVEIPEGIIVKNAPYNVVAGWIVNDDGTYSAPVQPGFEYDHLDNRYYSHAKYRVILHERTSNDTLQALRKIRDGDTSYDWQGWLDKLDAYNVAIEKTKDQEDYPLKVVYPEYPTR